MDDEEEKNSRRERAGEERVFIILWVGTTTNNYVPYHDPFTAVGLLFLFLRGGYY